jgi:hypothetical protein
VRKSPERARRWPFRPSSTRDKADEVDSQIAAAATKVFMRWLLVLPNRPTINNHRSPINKLPPW